LPYGKPYPELSLERTDVGDAYFTGFLLL